MFHSFYSAEIKVLSTIIMKTHRKFCLVTLLLWQYVSVGANNPSLNSEHWQVSKLCCKLDSRADTKPEVKDQHMLHITEINKNQWGAAGGLFCFCDRAKFRFRFCVSVVFFQLTNIITCTVLHGPSLWNLCWQTHFSASHTHTHRHTLTHNIKSWGLTCVHEVGQVEIQFLHWNSNVVRLHTQAGVRTLRRLYQPLPVSTFEGNPFE